ncbi:MAG: tripartite tricarboxylate transporter substrate binding protein [Burkholderiales bacterium]
MEHRKSIRAAWALAVVASAVCAAPADAQSASAGSQAYPARPLRFVVPFAPGGGADLMARLAGAKVAHSLGQQVVIDNRGGAGGNIAAELAAKSAPDGYTLFLPTVAQAISASLYRKLNYDVLKDFAAVTQLAATPFILAVHPNSPASSVKELIALAKAKPGQLSYGSSGNGGPSHLGTELFKSMAGVEVRHIPYKGGAPAAIDLMSGQIDMMFNTPPVILPHVRSGRMKALGVASLKRIPAAPEIPTVAESGVPGYELSTWYGVLVPAGTPAPIVKTLHGAFVASVKAPDVRERLAKENFDVVASTPAEFAAYVRAEVPKWAKVVKASGARVD